MEASSSVATGKHSHGRVSVPSLDAILGKEFPVLDHGFVRVVDYMGSDESIVQAARVSYGRGTKKRSQDRGLIRYLMRHQHTTPFEMCEIKFHVKLPIFVARQWIRHRTANVNEYSARYSILDNEFYLPDRAYLEEYLDHEKESKSRRRSRDLGQKEFDLSSNPVDLPEIEATAAQSDTNRQGRGQAVEEDEASTALAEIKKICKATYRAYTKLLNEGEKGGVRDPERLGIARELARTVLPTAFYTQWYWKTDLHNLLHFLRLRDDSHAQYEIRAYAQKVSELTRMWVPLAWEAYDDYQKRGAFFSAQEVVLLKRMVSGGSVDEEDSGLSKREWREFMEKLDQVPGG